MLIRTTFLLLAISVLFLSPGFAQVNPTFYGGNFSDNTKWSGDTIPAPGADIVIAAGASMNVDESYMCNSLTINTGSSFSCSGGSILTVGTGGIIDENGDVAIAISSSLEISSGIEVNPPATSGTFTDVRDGNTYNWVTIGNQVWMAENLAYLPSVNLSSDWSLTAPLFYVSGYNGTDVPAAKATPNYSTYGVLYNWPAAMAGAASSSANPSGIQGICPDGWHLPSDAEWTELQDFLTDDGHSGTEGDALKATSGWGSGGNGTDNYGFSALPGGSYSSISYFIDVGTGGFFWSSSRFSSYGPWIISMYDSYSTMSRYWDGDDNGISVRCVRD